MLKLSDYVQKGIFERVVRGGSGELLRVTFEIYESEGRLKGRVLQIEPVVALNGLTPIHSQNALCGACAKSTYPVEEVTPFVSVISPYNELYFFTSQPTRAPSIR